MCCTATGSFLLGDAAYKQMQVELAHMHAKALLHKLSIPLQLCHCLIGVLGNTIDGVGAAKVQKACSQMLPHCCCCRVQHMPLNTINRVRAQHKDRPTLCPMQPILHDPVDQVHQV